MNSKTKIPNDLTPLAYELSKKVFEGELTLTEAKRLFVGDNRINPNSATDYFINFRHFLQGERYTRTNNSFTTDYFLNKIFKDYGSSGLANALKALNLHIEYYEDLQKITMHKQRAIHEKYSNMVNETPDEIEQNDIIRIYKNQNKTKEEILNELKNLKQTDLEEITIKGKTYKRDNRTIAQIKILREFQCQICSTSIRKKDGSLYVEAAHVIAKHLRGRETLDNIILLCPNHHKEFDLGDLKIKKHDQDSIEFSLNGKEYCITFSFDLMTR